MTGIARGIDHVLAASVRTIDVLGFGFLLLILVIAVWRMPTYWRGKLLIYDRTRPWWPFGEALLRGWQRGLGAGLAGFAFGLAAIACEMVESAFGVALPDLLTGVLFAVMLALLLTVLAIMLLNRPKFLVPPRFRSEPGALSDWFGSRRRR